MGNSSSSRSSSKVIEEKIKNASKTGVINFADQKLSSSSTIWGRIGVELAGKLKTLDLSNNPIKELPAEVLLLTNLKSLHVNKCVLASLPALNVHLIQLKTLSLNKNRLNNSSLQALPEVITSLDLSFNEFSSFPFVLTTLTQLIELNLDNNQLTTIIGIGSLISLVTLYINDNQLTELPIEISRLVKLKHISLKRNNLSIVSPISNTQSIPAEFLIQTSVEHISLDGNMKLKTAELMRYAGMDAFLERRKRTKDKHMTGGIAIDHTLFGLDE
eukprot:gene9206-19089_t